PYCSMKISNSYDIKNAPRRIALRRRGIMLQKQPAAGGESCIAGFFLVSRIKMMLGSTSHKPTYMQAQRGL
ncbi:MAG: hypothetical protein SO401_00085, partial [Blautia sp.]|nr:hypothetical protein [Blautia sp.]